jgi:site-specific recombinase XerD
LATHPFDDGYDTRTVQQLLDHEHVKTTMFYANLLSRGAKGVTSRLDN